jgi:hypothetical protein
MGSYRVREKATKAATRLEEATKAATARFDAAAMTGARRFAVARCCATAGQGGAFLAADDCRAKAGRGGASPGAGSYRATASRGGAFRDATSCRATAEGQGGAFLATEMDRVALRAARSSDARADHDVAVHHRIASHRAKAVRYVAALSCAQPVCYPACAKAVRSGRSECDWADLNRSFVRLERASSGDHAACYHGTDPDGSDVSQAA